MLYVDYERGKKVTLTFTEIYGLRAAYYALRALDTVFRGQIIAQTMLLLRKDLLGVANLPPYKQRYYLCERCQSEIDTEVKDKVNHVHVVTATKDMWKHYICPPMKKNRP